MSACGLFKCNFDLAFHVKPFFTFDGDLYTAVLEIDGDQTEYPTGSEVVVYAGITLSGSASTLKGHKTRVTIPKEWIDPRHNGGKVIKASPAFSLRQDPIVSSDDEHYYIDFLYKPIAAGTIIKIPFSFRTKNVVVPDQSRIRLQSDFLNPEGKSLDHQEVTILNRSSQSFATYAYDGYQYDQRRDGEPLRTPVELDENRVFGLPIQYAPTGLGNGLGYYKSKKSLLTVRLDANPQIVFDPAFSSSNQSWTYDEAKRVLTKVIDTPSAADHRYSESLHFKFPDTPYDTPFKVLDFDIVALDYDGNPVESTRSNQSMDRIRLVLPPPPPPLAYRHMLRSYLDAYNNKMVYNSTEDRNRTVKFIAKTVNHSSWQNIPDGVDPETLDKSSEFLHTINVGNNRRGNYAPEPFYYHSILLSSSSSVKNPNELKQNVVYGLIGNRKTKLFENIELDKDYQIPHQLRSSADQFNNIQIESSKQG